ncbi:hypothetical protein C9426_12640 [Serratia sp. S1B]|nr:hypothetical protein C9426_12640 [Serratia sp. S1B]
MKKAIIIAMICASFVSICNANEWKYTEAKDEMRGSTTYIASLKAEDNNAQNQPGTPSLEILLFSKDGKIVDSAGLMLSDGWLSCKTSNECDVKARFGDGGVQDLSSKVAGESNQLLAVFDAKEFVETLRLSGKFFVEIPVRGEGRVQFKFLPKDIKWIGVEDGKPFLSMLGSLNLKSNQSIGNQETFKEENFSCYRDDDFKLFDDKVLPGKATICMLGGMIAKVTILYPHDKNIVKKIAHEINNTLGTKVSPSHGAWLTDGTMGIASILISQDKEKKGISLQYFYSPVLSVNQVRKVDETRN